MASVCTRPDRAGLDGRAASFLRSRRELLRRAGLGIASAAIMMSALFQPWVAPPMALAAGASDGAPSADDSTQTLPLPPVSEVAKLLANPRLAIARALATIQEREAGGADARVGADQESPQETPRVDMPPDRPAEPTASAPQPTATPEAPPAASSTGSGNPPPRAISTPEGFINAVALGAQDSQQQTGVPASVTIAQAILESDWGKSALSVKAQNYFGIKAISGPGPAGVIAMDTREVLGGQNVTMRDAFKAYHNLYESVMDHGRFLADNPRYANAFKTTDPKEFAQRIHDAGYATDPNYCSKVNTLIDKYQLDRYDVR